MITETTIQVCSLLTTILAGIFLYFERRNKKYDGFLEEYFDEVLNSYVTKWKQNPEINTVKFIRKKIRQSIANNKFFIPPYISYLVKMNDGEKIQKVLITDYIQNYPNSNNEKWKVTNNIYECINMIMLFLSFITLSASMIMIVPSVFVFAFEVLFYQSIKKVKNYAIVIMLGMIILFASIWIIKNIKKSETDYYSLEEEKIKKYIVQKVNYYDKKSSNFFI